MWNERTSGWRPAHSGSRSPRSAPRPRALPPIESTTLLGAGDSRRTPISHQASSSVTVARDAADVLVIGAGAAGAVVAKRLAEAGFGVVCLEQGAGGVPRNSRTSARRGSSSSPVPGIPTRTFVDFPRTIRARFPAPRSARSCSTRSAAARSTTRRSGLASFRPTSACGHSTASATTGRSPTRICGPSTSGSTSTWAFPGSAAIPPTRPARRRRSRRTRSGRWGGRPRRG